MKYLSLILIWLLFTMSAVAGPKWSIQQTQKAIEAGDAILVDIRRPAEWAETGVAEPAKLITMHDQNFVLNLNKLILENPGKQIAMICAVGGRSNYVNEALTAAGYDNIIDVTEGMLGSPAGPGWIKSDLPMRKVN